MHRLHFLKKKLRWWSKGVFPQKMGSKMDLLRTKRGVSRGLHPKRRPGTPKRFLEEAMRLPRCDRWELVKKWRGGERESFLRNNLHNGVVSGAARGQALLGPMWEGGLDSRPRSRWPVVAAINAKLDTFRSAGELEWKMGHTGALWVGGGSGGRGLTRACVGRPAPWWHAWWSAACALGGAAELRRRLGRTHRGRWGGAVRRPGPGALSGGRACTTLAARERRRRADWSRPFPCRAEPVGGGIAAAPGTHRRNTTWQTCTMCVHEPPARPLRTLAVRALRVFALCSRAAHACVPVLCAR